MSFVSVIMLIFCILGAIDRILGNKFGLGREFERGFMLLGNMALAMIGMIVLSPLIADLLSPCFDWIYNVLHLDPSIIPASLFANDMGGAALSAEINRDPAIGMFNALIISAMMGVTISYTIPYALGVVEKEHHHDMFLGLLCGFVTIPIGSLASGLILGLPVGSILLDLLPLVLFSGLIACGLIFLPQGTVKVFSILGKGIKIVITIGLVLGIIEFLTGYTLIPALADIWDGVKICINAAIVLSGAFPLMNIVSRILKKPIAKLGNTLSINSTAATGLISTLVTCATTFEMMNRMDKKGTFLNSSLVVSASFVFGSHLAFTMAYDATYIPAMIAGKLLSGFSALALAILLYKRLYKEN